MASPLLDSYNENGVITPALQRALDLARQRMFPGATMGQPGPVSAPPSVPQGGGELSAPPEDVPALTTPVSRETGPPVPPAQQKLQRLTTGPQGKSGISQIKNPWIRTPLQVIDAIGSTFLPALMMGMPGTELHHRLLVGDAAHQARQEQDLLDAPVKRREVAAHAADLESKPELLEARNDLMAERNKGGQFTAVPTASGYVVVDHKTGQAKPLTSADGQPYQPVEKVTPADKGTIHQDSEGNFYRIIGTTAEPVTADGKPLQGRVAEAKEPARDDKAIAIMSKPATQRTPEEVAYLKGYDEWVAKTKVQPGVLRMEAVTRPIVDPNDPTRLIYSTGGDAIRTGAAAPGSMDYQAGLGTSRDFTSGPEARTLNNINTAHAHISQLQRIADALHSGDIKAVNAIAQEIARQTGKPGPNSFQLLKTAVEGELGKTTTGGVTTVEEGRKLGLAINAANSPADLRDVLNNARELMESKRAVLRKQYESGRSGRPNFESGHEQDDMVTATLPDGRTGQIHKSQREQFLRDNPGAKVQ